MTAARCIQEIYSGSQSEIVGVGVRVSVRVTVSGSGNHSRS